MRGRETWGSSGVRHVFKTGNKWDGMREKREHVGEIKMGR